MHSPMYMYETEVQDRVSSYHWQGQAHLGRPEKQAHDGKAGSWLDSMQSNLRFALSQTAAATRRTTTEIRSWIAKPPAPQEQCC